jgi:hypothetical protein
MKTETLPPIPTVDPGDYVELSRAYQDQVSRGNYDTTICRITQDRVSELTAQALPPEGMEEIEREQAALSEKQAALESKRREKIQAVETYRSLAVDYQKKCDRLSRAEQQMQYELGEIEAQREYILSQLGVLNGPFDRVGAFTPLFAHIATLEVIHREWPLMREKLEAEKNTAHKAALAHAKKHGIGQTKPARN